MGVIFITFRSVTPAQRGEVSLRKSGIRCSLGRTPREMEAKGCGYCIRLRQEHMVNAVRILREGQIPFRKVYLQYENGTTEEVAI